MRFFFSISLWVICLLVSGQQARRFAIKSGYLKTEVSGNTVGTKELWWDNYGNKTCELEKTITTTKMFGMKNEEKTHALTILVDGNYWVRDYEKKTATKGQVPMYEDTQKMMNDMTEAERETFANQLLESMGGKKLGQEKLGDYTCDVFTVLGAKSWAYKGLVLKSEAKMMGIAINEQFVDFKPNQAVASSKFTAPSDMPYKNLQDVAGNPFSAMNFNDMDNQALEDADEKVYPVKYPFEKFKKVVAGLNDPGYRNSSILSMEGSHMATFTKGMGALIVAAVSRKNADMNQVDQFESFTVAGRTCYYGQTDEEEEGNALIVDYPQYDMYITLVGVPELSKQELIEISKKLSF